MIEFTNIFHIDNISMVMGALTLFVGLCAGTFSLRYLKGDSARTRFYMTLVPLVASVLVLVCADHLVLFVAAWGISNLLLARLMVHKASWKAARESGWLTLKNGMFSTLVLGLAMAILSWHTGDTSLRSLVSLSYDAPFLSVVLGLILVAAMAQSALWPFHRWLLSSLNSPTPVSAVMHAGLVNGGGFLLVRFAPLYMQQTGFLNILLVAGLVTAFLGTLWKLMQSDVKRMLACSTMGQMGFMVVQCGLGLFSSAMAHLVWHGLFKAYLFLASGAAAQEKRMDLGYPPRATVFLMALVCGAAGAWAFAAAARLDVTVLDTRLFLVGMSFLTAAQIALSILRDGVLKKMPLALLAVATTGALYGLSVWGFDRLVPQLTHAQPMTWVHGGVFAFMVISWIFIVFARAPSAGARPSSWRMRLYVAMLNAAQPHPKTVTAHRNDYQYSGA
jgi:NAD(P)H-quinone oxidoreductase subunit 5